MFVLNVLMAKKLYGTHWFDDAVGHGGDWDAAEGHLERRN